MKYTIDYRPTLTPYRPTTTPLAGTEITVKSEGPTLISRASGATTPGHRIGTDEEGRDLYAAPEGWDALGTVELAENGWVLAPVYGSAVPRHGHCLSAWLSRSLRDAPMGIEQSAWVEALEEAAAQAARGKSGTIELDADVGELDADDIEMAARHAVEIDRREAEPHAIGEPEWRADDLADMLGVECVSEEAMTAFEEAYRAEWMRTARGVSA